MSFLAAPRETLVCKPRRCHVAGYENSTHALRASDRVKSPSTTSVPQVMSCLVQGCLRKAPSPSGTQNKPRASLRLASLTRGVSY